MHGVAPNHPPGDEEPVLIDDHRAVLSDWDRQRREAVELDPVVRGSHVGCGIAAAAPANDDQSPEGVVVIA